MYESVDLRDFMQILVKRLWMIVSVTLVISIGTALLSFYVMTPVYEAKTDILLNQSENVNTVPSAIENIESNLRLIETYRVIIESPRIMDLVIQKLGSSINMKTLMESTRVETIKDSQVISVIVDDPDQHRAVLIANTIASTFQEEIVKLVNINNVHILAPAKVDNEALPIKPRPFLNTAIAFVLGIATSIALSFLLEKLDTTLGSDKDIEQYLGLPILATIPVIKRKDLQRVKRSPDVGGGPIEKAETG